MQLDIILRFHLSCIDSPWAGALHDSGGREMARAVRPHKTTTELDNSSYTVALTESISTEIDGL